MDKIKRFIDIYVPVTTCTLRCSYCYITTHRLFDGKLPSFRWDPKTFGKAFSQERLGGICMINMCGGGETLLPPELPLYVKALLEQGHYVSVVTNGTINRAFDDFLSFPPEYMERLFFKFSYHYLELKKRNLLDNFFTNIRKMRDAGASYTLEATPSDDWIPYIAEMKNRAVNEVGSICHISVARDERDMGTLPILTKMDTTEYQRVWETFNSKLFEYKLSVFNKKRSEFCYAGDWTLWLDMGTGILHQCYCDLFSQDMFRDVNKPIQFRAIGHHCQQPHCFNAHAFLTFGAIPNHCAPTYAEIRNRVCVDGSEWLQPKMKAFMNQKLKENNKEYSFVKRGIIDIEMSLYAIKKSLIQYIRKYRTKLNY